MGMWCEQSCSPAQGESSRRQRLLHCQQCHPGKLNLEIPVFPTCLLSRLFQAEVSDVPQAFSCAPFWHMAGFGSLSTNFSNSIFT